MDTHPGLLSIGSLFDPQAMSVVGYEKGEDDRRTMSQEKEERGACKFKGREKRHSGITPQKGETPSLCVCVRDCVMESVAARGRHKEKCSAALVNG